MGALGYRQVVAEAMPTPVFVPPPVPDLSRRQWLWGAAAAALLGQGLAHAQQRPEKPRLTLALGGKTALYYLPLTIAEQLKYFSAEGLEVDLQDHAGDSLAQQALLQGQADLAAGGFERVILLRQHGVNCRAFAALGRAPQLVFAVNARTLPNFKHLVQLKGRRVGVTALEATSHWFARMLLARAGVSPADVEFVGVGTSTAAVGALREGRIDAISDIDPVMTQLELRGDIRVVADTRSLRGTQELYGGPMPGGCVYAPQAFVVRYPNTAQAVANAVVRALKWLQTAGPSDIVRAVPESYMYGDRAIYLAALEKAREALSPDGMAAEEGVATAHRVVAQYPNGSAAVRSQAPGTTYTNDFARRAKAKFQVSGLSRDATGA